MIIGIDVGLRHPAISIISNDGALLWSFKVDPPTKGLLEYRFSALMHDMNKLIEDIFKDSLFQKNRVVIEMPGFQSSLKGQKAAERQDLSKLCYSFGMITTLVLAKFGWGDVHFVSPMEWKGQTPKKITRKRMEEKYGLSVKDFSDDQIDALGIAVYYYDKHKE